MDFNGNREYSDELDLNEIIILNAIAKLKDPATFEEILDRVLATAQGKKENLPGILSDLLNEGQLYGFIRQEGDRFHLYDVDRLTGGPGGEELLEFYSDLANETLRCRALVSVAEGRRGHRHRRRQRHRHHRRRRRRTSNRPSSDSDSGYFSERPNRLSTDHRRSRSN